MNVKRYNLIMGSKKYLNIDIDLPEFCLHNAGGGNSAEQILKAMEWHKELTTMGKLTVQGTNGTQLEISEVECSSDLNLNKDENMLMLVSRRKVFVDVISPFSYYRVKNFVSDCKRKFLKRVLPGLNKQKSKNTSCKLKVI